MRALDALRALARGERVADALLPPCRLEALGAEHHGEEAVVASFRRAPLQLSDAADVVEAEGQIALFEGDTALFADLHGRHIARLWRLGPGEPAAREPAIGVPFDTDLVQSRRGLAARAEDHPQLSAAGFAAIEAIGAQIAHGWSPQDGPAQLRVRPFLLRAFTAGAQGAALFAVHRLGGGAVRSTGFAYAAARFRTGGGGGDARIIRDIAGEAGAVAAEWRPRAA
jgi:hypothetical protein